MAHKDRPNDSHLRSSCCLIAEIDINAAAAIAKYASVSLPAGVTGVTLAYEIHDGGSSGTNVSFEVSGRPAGGTAYHQVKDANTITPGMYAEGTAVAKWEEWKVNYSAKAGTFDAGSTLKVWIIT